MAKGKSIHAGAVPGSITSDEIHDFVENIDDPLLSMSEAGHIIGKSPQTISRWMDEGLLAFYRDPTGLRRVRKSELVRFYGATALVRKNPIREQDDG